MITFFYRNHNVGFSIKKVADVITNLISDKVIYEMPSQYASLCGVISNMLFTWKHKNKKGINHIVGDVHYCILPLLNYKTVLTIHDTVAYDKSRGVKKILLKYFWFKLPLKFASKVVCISEATKHSIQRFTNRKDLMVIYNAISPDFVYVGKKFNDKNPTILLIGTNWNKNIDRTLQALEGIVCNIVIVGNLTVSQISYLNTHDFSYVNKTNLTDNEILSEYINCDIVSFCSIYEGFGMPVIEANAIGRPVITSNIEPLIEVANNAALFVDPYDFMDIKEKILQIIKDKKLRDTLIKNGLKNVRRFDRNKILLQYKYLYNDILKKE